MILIYWVFSFSTPKIQCCFCQCWQQWGWGFCCQLALQILDHWIFSLSAPWRSSDSTHRSSCCDSVRYLTEVNNLMINNQLSCSQLVAEGSAEGIGLHHENPQCMTYSFDRRIQTSPTKRHGNSEEKHCTFFIIDIRRYNCYRNAGDIYIIHICVIFKCGKATAKFLLEEICFDSWRSWGSSANAQSNSWSPNRSQWR